MARIAGAAEVAAGQPSPEGITATEQATVRWTRGARALGKPAAGGFAAFGKGHTASRSTQAQRVRPPAFRAAGGQRGRPPLRRAHLANRGAAGRLQARGGIPPSPKLAQPCSLGRHQHGWDRGARDARLDANPAEPSGGTGRQSSSVAARSAQARLLQPPWITRGWDRRQVPPIALAEYTPRYMGRGRAAAAPDRPGGPGWGWRTPQSSGPAYEAAAGPSAQPSPAPIVPARTKLNPPRHQREATTRSRVVSPSRPAPHPMARPAQAQARHRQQRQIIPRARPFQRSRSPPSQPQLKIQPRQTLLKSGLASQQIAESGLGQPSGPAAGPPGRRPPSGKRAFFARSR